ncbi:MAG: hypothetical protein WCJ30_22315 [Deltaproteobacteria bacterium]
MALGYFLAYVPYAALTKGVTDGRIPGVEHLPGAVLLPISNIASMVGMMAFITGARWWRHAGRRRVLGMELPVPGPYTFVSGLGTATVIVTTTLAYTFHGVSIVFMMLLLRGGVLVLAPLVDALSGRAVRWFSWMALGLSLGSLVVAFSGHGEAKLSLVAGIDVTAYLLAYFVRLRFMSRIAKSNDPDASRRYFVEEQMVATPAVVVSLIVLSAIGPEPLRGHLRHGFTALGGVWTWITAVVIGLCSQGTGIFGGLVLLDKRENSFCVPVNRASSMLAGLGATLVLTVIWHGAAPDPREFLAASMVIGAIVVLSLAPRFTRAKA